MYRMYFQLAGQCAKSFISLNKSVFVRVNYETHMAKRWAGHSKWQNIKSTKQIMAQTKSVAFFKLDRQIDAAVKEGGHDMATNQKLKALWEEAKKINMSKERFESSIKGAQAQTSETPYWTVFSGPKGVVVGFEVIFSNRNPGFLQSKFAPQLKKLKLKLEPYFQELCVEKGIIITNPAPNTDNTYEKAVEDAIEIGLDEVFENDDKTLIFECVPNRVYSLQQQLQNKGYHILSASTELDFKDFIKLNEEEIQDLEMVINKLKNFHSEIIRASYNVKNLNNSDI